MLHRHRGFVEAEARPQIHEKRDSIMGLGQHPAGPLDATPTKWGDVQEEFPELCKRASVLEASFSIGLLLDGRYGPASFCD